MSQQETPPLAGLLRVVFFLAVAVLAITVVVTGVTTLYEAPSRDEGEFQQVEGFEGFTFQEDQERADYNRNIGLILGLIGTVTIGVGLLGLGSRFNPLRAGLLAGGVSLVMGGVGVGSSGSDDWLTFLTSGLAFLTLMGSSLWLEAGLPVETLTGRAGGGGQQEPG